MRCRGRTSRRDVRMAQCAVPTKALRRSMSTSRKENDDRFLFFLADAIDALAGGDRLITVRPVDADHGPNGGRCHQRIRRIWFVSGSHLAHPHSVERCRGARLAMVASGSERAGQIDRSAAAESQGQSQFHGTEAMARLFSIVVMLLRTILVRFRAGRSTRPMAIGGLIEATLAECCRIAPTPPLSAESSLRSDLSSLLIAFCKAYGPGVKQIVGE
jgi:hypothetical protein